MPALPEVRAYELSLMTELVSRYPVDWVHLDYIRFPSDGNMRDMQYPVWDGKAAKSEVIRTFFAYLRKQMAGTPISADLFGLATVNSDDPAYFGGFRLINDYDNENATDATLKLNRALGSHLQVNAQRHNRRLARGVEEPARRSVTWTLEAATQGTVSLAVSVNYERPVDTPQGERSP